MTKQQRQSAYLVVAEGVEEAQLSSAILAGIGLTRVDVFASEGQGDIRSRTSAACKMAGPDIRALVVVRDAEDSLTRRVQSTIDLFRDLGFPVPVENLAVASDANRRAGFIVIPWDREAGYVEDLCLQAVRSPDALDRMDSALADLASKKIFLPQSAATRQKARVQAYLAGVTRDRAVHRCGLGVAHRHFDLSSSALQPIVEFFGTIFKV